MAAKAKDWYLSRTVWFAVAQGISGVLMAFLVENPALESASWFLMVKSVVDIILRFDTNRPVV